MLDDDAGRIGLAKFGDQFDRRVGIVAFVIAELLALHLFGLSDAARGGAGGQIGRRVLVRIRAIGQRVCALRGKERKSVVSGESVADGEDLSGRRVSKKKNTTR